MNNEDFKLESDDAAIIFKKDLTTEMYLPNFDPEAVVDFDDHQNVYIAIAISLALNDDDFREIINHKLGVIFSASEIVSDDMPKGCTGCGGHCHQHDDEEDE